jgi:hypothetical protein
LANWAYDFSFLDCRSPGAPFFDFSLDFDGDASGDEGGGDSDELTDLDSFSALTFFLPFASVSEVVAARFREDFEGFTGESCSCLIGVPAFEVCFFTTGDFFSVSVAPVVAPVELLVTLLAVEETARVVFDILVLFSSLDL